MRLFNPTRETVKGIVSFSAKIKAAYFTDLNEKRIGDAMLLDTNSVILSAVSNKIVTLEMEMEEQL